MSNLFNRCSVCNDESKITYTFKNSDICSKCFVSFEMVPEGEIDHWITTSTGQKIPVRKGESNLEAVNSKFGINKHKLIASKEHYDFVHSIENVNDLHKLYINSKNFANMSDVLSMYSTGLSRELNMFDDSKISIEEFSRASKELGLPLKSINSKDIEFNKETLRNGLTNLHKTINAIPPKSMILYRGFTTKDINDPKFKFDVNTHVKLNGLNAFSNDESIATSFSIPHAEKMGDSVILKFEGNIKALPTKAFTPVGFNKEDEYITNVPMRIDKYRIENRVHKNTGYRYKRYHINMKIINE